MILPRLALSKVQLVIARRILDLASRAQAGDAAGWFELYAATTALAACASVPTAMEPGGLVSTAELQQRLGVSKRTIRRRRARGELAPVQVGGRGRTHRWRV